jgi:MFS family permease
LPWGAYQRTHKSDPCDCLIDDSSALAGSAGRRTARVVLGIYIKNHDPRQWGLWEFVLAAANFGTLLGGLVATVLRDNLTDEQLASWGWRLPFLSGIVVSFSGFYLRSHGDPEHVPASFQSIPIPRLKTTVMKMISPTRHLKPEKLRARHRQ